MKIYNYIYGEKTIRQFVKKGVRIYKVFSKKGADSDFLKWLEKRNIPLASFKNIPRCISTSKNVVAQIEEYKYLTLNELINKNKRKERPILVISNNISDPQNLGSMIKTLSALSIDGLIIPSHNQVKITSTVHEISEGTAFDINVALTNSLNTVLQKLKKEGYWIVSASMDGKTEFSELNDLNQPLAIIMGSEGKGVSQSLLKKTDFQLSIQMDDSVESLNVSVATAIILFNLVKWKKKE